LRPPIPLAPILMLSDVITLWSFMDGSGETYCLHFVPRKLVQRLCRNLQSIRHSTRRHISESFPVIFTTQKSLKRSIMSTRVIHITCAISLNEHPVESVVGTFIWFVCGLFCWQNTTTGNWGSSYVETLYFFRCFLRAL